MMFLVIAVIAIGVIAYSLVRVYKLTNHIEPSGTMPEDEQSAVIRYREGITTLIRLKSKEKPSCQKPSSAKCVIIAFIQTAQKIVRISDSDPDPEIYNDEDLIIEASLFLRRGGRIQYLHGDKRTKLQDLLENLEKEGLLQAQSRKLTKDYNGAFTTVDENGFRLSHKKGGIFCANDHGKTIQLNKVFEAEWVKAKELCSGNILEI